jgi:hypothetical protein
VTRSRRFQSQGDDPRIARQSAGGPFTLGPHEDVRREIPGAAENATLPAPTGEPRLALLIGNSRYKWADVIDNPVRDVRLMAWALEGLGFTVTRIENAGLVQMQDAVLAFGEALDTAGSQAVAMLYFAGHGIQQDGVNFLIPVDAHVPSLRYLAARTVALDAVVAELAHTQRKATVILLDACRDALPGLEAETVSPPEGGLTEGLTRARLPRPAQLVYSTAAQTVSSDGSRENSPFAQALADELPGLLTPGRRIQDVIDDVAARVSLATDGEQTVAVYREGVLLPLALTAQDEARLRDWSKRRPYRLSRRQIVWRTLAAAAAIAAVTAATLWFGAYPETRTTWLLRAGLLDRSSYDFACEPPWDGQPDRYGLTRRDWCLSMDERTLTEKVAKAGKWDSDVAAGLSGGDPKALYLAAIAKGRDVGGLTGLEREAALGQAVALAARAAGTDLPRGILAPYMVGQNPLKSDRGLASFQRDFTAARDAGVLFAAVTLPFLASQWHVLDPKRSAVEASAEIDAALQRAAAFDADGAMAIDFAAMFSGRIGLWSHLASPERERYWLRRAAFAGHGVAAAELLDRERIDPAYLLSDDEKGRLSATAAAGDGPAALFWRSRSGPAAGGPKSEVERMALLTRAADGGFLPAIHELVDHDLADGGQDRTDVADALRWLERGKALGDPRSIGRLGALLARGRSARDGRVLVPARPDEARALLERPEVASDPRAMIALARLLRYGPAEQRDTRRAETLLRQIEARLPFPDIALSAREETRRIRIERALALGIETSVAVAVGSLQAPLTISIALVPSCRDCRIAERLRLLEPFTKTGSARVVLLPIWSEGSQVDSDAAVIAACAAPQARLPVLLRLIERQANWSAPADRGARRLALADALADFDGAPMDLAACLADRDAEAAIGRQRDVLVRSLDVRNAPTVFVGGEQIRSDRADDLLAAVEDQLPPDAAHPTPTPP